MKKTGDQKVTVEFVKVAPREEKLAKLGLGGVKAALGGLTPEELAELKSLLAQ